MKLLTGLIVVLIIAFVAFESNAAIKNTGSSNKQKTVVVKDSSKKSTEKVDNGFGPIKELKLGPIDKKLVKEGKNIFNSKCFACHKLDSKLVGPPLRNITKKLTPVFIMNYLLNTAEMQKKDPQLKALVKKFNGILMPDQNLNKKQARSVLEYLRSVEK